MWENPAMTQVPRAVFAGIFVACAALLATAIFYMQEYLGLEPCPMCILQRYAFIAIGVIALAGAIHNPRGAALKAYSALVILFAIAGAGVAIRHSYLQHFPPEVESCGTDLDFLLHTFSLNEAFPKIFAGTGSCSKTAWKLLGLSIPEWALVWYVIFALVALWLAFFRKPR
jgi:disulfide bond formation protein DsbB